MPAPRFAVERDSCAAEELASAVAGFLPVADPSRCQSVLGSEWARLVPCQIYGGSGGYQWFIGGEPLQVVVGVGATDIVVSPAGEPEYFDPDDPQRQDGLSRVVADVSALQRMHAAVAVAAAVERSRRIWCATCHRLRYPSLEPYQCRSCYDLNHGTLR
jgi:hypothetical protein